MKTPYNWLSSIPVEPVEPVKIASIPFLTGNGQTGLRDNLNHL